MESGRFYFSQALFVLSSPPSALSDPESDGESSAYLQCITYADIGLKGCGGAMTTFWWRLVDEPGAFPPELLVALLPIPPCRVGRKVPAGSHLERLRDSDGRGRRRSTPRCGRLELPRRGQSRTWDWRIFVLYEIGIRLAKSRRLH